MWKDNMNPKLMLIITLKNWTARQCTMYNYNTNWDFNCLMFSLPLCTLISQQSLCVENKNFSEDIFLVSNSPTTPHVVRNREGISSNLWGIPWEPHLLCKLWEHHLDFIQEMVKKGLLEIPFPTIFSRQFHESKQEVGEFV